MQSLNSQQIKDRTPSTRSIGKQQSKDRRIDSHHSLTPSTKSMILYHFIFLNLKLKFHRYEK